LLTDERVISPKALDTRHAPTLSYDWRGGWALSNRPDADLVIKALDMAYEQRGRPQGLLFHSDRLSFFRLSKTY
jgi:hypothetical protein